MTKGLAKWQNTVSIPQEYTFPLVLALEQVEGITEAVDIYAFLGILNIFQSHYLLVVTDCEEVGRVDTCLAVQNMKKPPVIFAVT